MPATEFTAICLIAVATLLVAEFKRHQPGRVIAKSAASFAFVGVALSLGAMTSGYGQLVLLALVLSAAGDLLLLSDRSVAFLSGLGAFLASHAAYAAAFSVSGVSVRAAAVAALVALLFGVVVIRWLWPRLNGSFRAPVVAYVVVILGMCCVAVGYASASGRWLVAVGAGVFAASDLAVAREKFVHKSFVNRAWGLPAYYCAQLLLAWSIA